MGYMELFSKTTGWCFGYTIDIIDGEPMRHIRVCEKSEKIRQENYFPVIE